MKSFARFLAILSLPLMLLMGGKTALAADGDGDGIGDAPIVSAGLDHTCALDSTGVHCWGDNSYGQTTVPALVNPVTVSAGYINSDGKADLIIGIPGFDLPATPTTKIIKDAGAVKVLSGAGF
jgi:hypothetical protein